MNANQKIHNATLSKWLELFKEQKASGLTVRDWCAREGYTTHSYYYWKRKAKEAYVDSAMPDIAPVPLSLVEQSANVSVPAAGNHPNIYDAPLNLCNSHNLRNSCTTCGVSVTIDGIHVDFDASVSDDRLIHIIGALRHV